VMDIDPIVEALRQRFPREGLGRVEECLEYLSGARKPDYPHPLQEPTRLFFPGLRAKPWHDAADFAWLPETERAAGAVLAELEALLAQNAGFFPYEDPYTLELGWKGWETFTLYRKGKRHKKNAERCPATVELLERSRGIRQGMFSRLKPGAHLAPHTGGVNVVLTCHLGLIVPEGCAIRVGGEARGWQPGKCLVFDDSFIHEAWNHGSETRFVLLWDVWHPDLTELEISALKTLFPILDKMLLGAGAKLDV
jgi:aspartyl/asparaginyl beta-hydroxylase (cupin superfamily)